MHCPDLGPFYMEKSCPGQEGHPPSRVNFSERLYEKKVYPFARVKSWLSNGNSARACSDRLALTELTRLGHSRSQRPRSFWSAPRIETSGRFQISSPRFADFRSFCAVSGFFSKWLTSQRSLPRGVEFWIENFRFG